MTLIERAAIVPGLLASATLAAVATSLGTLAPVVGTPVPGILLGVAARRALRSHAEPLAPGVPVASTAVLQLAVVLLGAQLSLREVADVGAGSLPVMLGTLFAYLAVGALVGRRLGRTRPAHLFLTVAGQGGVGKAAAAHGISQPSASARLTRLERQIGVSPPARSTTGTTLIPAGAAFAAWAGRVEQGTGVLADNVATLRETRCARLHIVASLTVAEYLPPTWLLLLRRAHPELDVVAEVANSHEVVERLRAGHTDLGSIKAPTVPPRLTARAVGADRLALLEAPDHPAARRRTPIDLLDQALLLREHGSGTRETFVHALSDALGHDVEPDPRHATELGSTATILATARAGGGVGVGVVSERAAPTDGTLSELPVAGPDAVRTLHAVWTGRHPSAAARLLLELAATSPGACG